MPANASAALELVQPTGRALPDYLPAGMVSQFVYCPRLFYFQQVEGVFAQNEHTIEGASQHRRVDREGRSTPPPDRADEEPVVVTSVTLSSDEHRVIAKLDLAKFQAGCAIPIEYKRGRPMAGEAGVQAWPSDQVQIAIQALVLRANGYRCDEGFLFYRKTQQRVNILFDSAVLREAEKAIAEAWKTATAPLIPPPLVDSPKCPGCSLVSICMPDETKNLREQTHEAIAEQYGLFKSGIEARAPRKGPASETRMLVAPRVDLKPLYLNTQGLRVGKSGDVLVIRERDKVVQEVRINETCQVNLMGNVQITTQAIQALCQAEKPICYFSHGGWFYGITTGLNMKNVILRRSQLTLADQGWFRLRVSRSLVAGKIKNQRTMLLRNHVEPPQTELRELKRLATDAATASSLEELLGIEGYAASIYFRLFGGMLKREATVEGKAEFDFKFKKRNRRPPRDPVNALLSYGYSLLTKDLTIESYAVGFDPMVGYYHQPRHGRPALALDLMEPLRPLIVDSAVLSAVNTKMVSERDFVAAGKAVSMTAGGRKAFLRAYEARMDTLVTHPHFGYRISYRRLLAIQSRLLGKTIQGELDDYPVFVTR